MIADCLERLNLRVIRRLVITVLTFHGGDGFPVLVARRLVHEVIHLSVTQINVDLTRHILDLIR